MALGDKEVEMAGVGGPGRLEGGLVVLEVGAVVVPGKVVGGR